MSRGFFTKSELLSMSSKPDYIDPRCDLCKLHKGCISPKMPPTGEGGLGILIVAEAPGAKEDERNTQLIGKAGQRLRSVLSQIGVDLDEDCWKTNAVACRPPSNRTPTHAELEYCRPNLAKTINSLQPHTIITLGESALRQVISPYWKKDIGGISRWAGYQIPLQPINTWICPTWHSSYIEREKNDVLTLWFRKHLEAAFKITRRPWKDPPNYTSKIEKLDSDSGVVGDVDQMTGYTASGIIDQMIGFTGMAAVDYETNMIKPDGDKSSCISCAIAWGHDTVERCIAFPITSENKRALTRFLRSPVAKIAANCKFEERWSMRYFGTRVRNWIWDTMQCAHILDNRRGVTSLDFQAFVRLGFPTYSNHIEPILSAGGTVTVNRILSEISMSQLLEYNALDVITEFELALIQMKEMRS